MRTIRRLVSTLFVLTAVMAVVPGVAGADDPRAQRDAVRARQAQAASHLDVLRANQRQIQQALDVLDQNVRTERGLLTSAQSAEREAAATSAAAQGAARAAAQRLDDARGELTRLAVRDYTNPNRREIAGPAITGDPNETARRIELARVVSGVSADVLDRARAARLERDDQQRTADAAAAVAAQRRAEIERRVARLKVARDQQAKLVGTVEQKVDAAMTQVDALAARDAQLSADIARGDAQAAALRRQQLLAAAAAPASGGVGSAGPAVVVASGAGLATVRGITVAGSIAGQLAAMLNAADAAGVALGGSGWRDPSQQIALRRQNCGTSTYAVYEMSSGQCSPPTARPGSSMHEQGLAIDMTWNGASISSHTNPGYQWLAANGARFGFFNLPSEPWHWSVNGQ